MTYQGSNLPGDWNLPRRKFLPSFWLKPSALLAAAVLTCAPLADMAAVAGAKPDNLTAHSAKIKIALYKGPGTGGNGPPDLLKQLNATNAPTSLVEITPDEIRAGALTNFDVVIFAGGSGSQEAKAIGEEGRAEVEKFVGHGGGYIGICAGAYLATARLARRMAGNSESAITMTRG